MALPASGEIRLGAAQAATENQVGPEAGVDDPQVGLEPIGGVGPEPAQAVPFPQKEASLGEPVQLPLDQRPAQPDEDAVASGGSGLGDA